MRFVSTSKSAYSKAIMAYMFLENAAKSNKINEIYNLQEVIEALDPSKVVDGFLEYCEKHELEEAEIKETD